ncbi:cupin domain-containing protein [Streptomyces sp. NPDC001939]
MLSGFAISRPDETTPLIQINEGIQARRIKEASPADPSVALILYLAEGADFGWERHKVREIVYVLEGEFGDGTNTYGPDTMFFAEEGSEHHPQSAKGCKLLVIFPDGEAA